MSAAVSGPSRWNVARVIARRDAETVLRGLGVYLALTIALAAATWMLLIDVRALEGAGLLVSSNPFRAPLQVAMLVLAAYFAVSAAVSVARDRESGTLEVLFYAPVDEVTYILGKAGGMLLAYMAALPLLLASFALLSLMTGFALTPAILLSLALSIVPAAETICFGILLAVGTGRIRTAVLLLVGVTVLLLGVTIAYQIVSMIPIAEPSSPLLPLRDALAAVNAVVREVSPFAYLDRVVDGALIGAWRTVLLGLLTAVFVTLVMVGLAAAWLRHRGVERRGE